MFSLWAFMASSIASSSILTGPCLTMSTWEDWYFHPRPVLSERRSEKIHQESFGTPEENVRFSEHFALHWGNDFTPSDELLDDILDVFELTWQVEIEVLGMTAPSHTSQYYFNVYLGSTGSNTPDDYNVSGYYYTDNEGYPMVVLGEYVQQNWNSGKSTIPHEFFHALQHETGQYASNPQSRWYWEASASWVENVVLPTSPYYSVFLFGYAFLPHYPLNFFDYFDSGSLEEYHAYGAFIFPQYLSDFVVDDNTVADSWLDPQATDPLLWWRGTLEDEGLDFAEVLSDFAAHNAFWDYPHQTWYEGYLGQYEGTFEREAEPIARSIPSSGTSGWWGPPTDLRPGQYGVNILEWNAPTLSAARIAFDGALVGDAFSDVNWKVQVIQSKVDGSLLYWPIDIVDAVGELDLLDLQSTDQIRISVMADAIDANSTEVFDYEFSVGSIPDEDQNPIEEEKPMTCQSATISQMMGLNFLGYLMWYCYSMPRRLRFR